MPQILTKQDVLGNPNFFISEIKAGKIFIYPTDTLYGLGGNACLDVCIEKINQVKGRSNKPLLVIAPGWQWLEANCLINKEAQKLIQEKWPGPYSFVLLLKNRAAVSVILLNDQATLGVRWPKHWLVDLIQQVGAPFISTSANLSGQPPAKVFAEINPTVLNQVDYAIKDDLGVSGRPSTIIDLSQGSAKIMR